jgi:hypothetical protein
MADIPVSVRDMRRQWKRHKERLNGQNAEHPTSIRFHRACSWLQRAEQFNPMDDLDLALLNQWIAFNSLYGQWNTSNNEPLPDVLCWQQFLERMLALDKNQFVVNALMDHKPLAMTIFDDEYLSRYFWQDPTDQRANKSKSQIRRPHLVRTGQLAGHSRSADGAHLFPPLPTGPRRGDVQRQPQSRRDPPLLANARPSAASIFTSLDPPRCRRRLGQHVLPPATTGSDKAVSVTWN